MRDLQIILLFIIFLQIKSSLVSQSRSDLVKQAKGYYLQSNYKESAKLFSQILSPNLSRKELEIAAECFKKANQLDKLCTTYEYLIKEKKRNKDYRIQYAQALHHSNKFVEASAAYKSYLKLVKKSDDAWVHIQQRILQCENGAFLRRKDKNSLVEPLNNTINTEEDEFAPLPSHNYQGRYYFSAVRKVNDRLKNNNEVINTDIYSIEDNNGNWSVMKSMSAGINTADHEVIIDFINEGKGMLFQRYNSKKNTSELLSKNFDFKYDTENINITVPLDKLNEEFDLCLFQDTICVFSSQAPGGYGSRDLYLSIFRNGRWTHPKNLGSVVNTPFDEINPFLSKDGRTLYYSSNNLQSVGGFDVFKTEFLAESNSWSIPVNLGLPINTAADEHNFKLNRNGLSGVFSSDRKDLSQGGKDIFIAYFKEELEEQFYDENGSVLSYFLDYSSQLNNKSFAEKKSANVLRPSARIINCESIISAEDDYLNSNLNKKSLQFIFDIMKQYPEINIQLIGHSTESNNSMINLFSSTKKAEQLAQYLKTNSIEENRIQVLGVGSARSISQKNSNSLVNSQEQFQNNRIEYFLSSVPIEKINIKYNKINVPEVFRNEEQYQFQRERMGLTYSCLLGESTQMLDKNLSSLNSAIVFCEFRNGKYYYYSGIVNKLSEAKDLISVNKLSGSIFIQAFMDGKYIDSKAIINYASQYPDLILLIDYNKNLR